MPARYAHRCDTLGATMGQQSSRIFAAVVAVAARPSQRRMLAAPAAGMAPPMERASTQCTLAAALEFTQIKEARARKASLAAYLTGEDNLGLIPAVPPEPPIVAGCIDPSYYEARGMDDETMDVIRRRLTPAQQMRRIFTLREHQASSAYRIEDDFRACSCNSLFVMLAEDARAESMLECRYGPSCTGRSHIIALDKDKVVETVDGWITYCLERQLPPWAHRPSGARWEQGDIKWAAAKIDVPADSPLAVADVVVLRSFGDGIFSTNEHGRKTNEGASIQEAPVSDSEWI